MRHLGVEPISFYKQNLSSVGSVDVDLKTVRMKPDYTYHFLNVVGFVSGTSLTQASIGFISEGRFNIMRKRSTDDPFETVEYVGEMVLKEGEQIQIRFHNTAEGDKLYLWANGYARRL